jgi:hypothetical protein
MFRGNTGGGQIIGGFLHCTAPHATPQSRAAHRWATAQQAGVSRCLCSSTRSSRRSSKPFRAASGLLRNALTTKHTRFPIQNRPSTCSLPYYCVICAGRLPRQALVSSDTRLTGLCVLGCWQRDAAGPVRALRSDGVSRAEGTLERRYDGILRIAK